MIGSKNLLVTCVYNNLNGTELGGRVGRTIHYTKSLSTLTKTNQDIVVYTTEEDKNILLKNERIKNYDKIRFIIFDLYSDKNREYYKRKKVELNQINSDRCYEIMHNKVNWMNNHVNEGYDYIYWIDAGLSYGALFPIRFRGDETYANYYENTLFTPKIFESLNKINDKIVLLGGNQTYHIFETPPNAAFGITNQFPERYHVIGGFFGGRSTLVSEFYNKYDFFLNKMVELNVLDREEHILTLLLNEDVTKYHLIEFTTWHHEESDMAKYNKEEEIYFYKIFENLNQ